MPINLVPCMHSQVILFAYRRHTGMLPSTHTTNNLLLLTYLSGPSTLGSSLGTKIFNQPTFLHLQTGGWPHWILSGPAPTILLSTYMPLLILLRDDNSSNNFLLFLSLFLPSGWGTSTAISILLGIKSQLLASVLPAT